MDLPTSTVPKTSGFAKPTVPPHEQFHDTSTAHRAVAPKPSTSTRAPGLGFVIMPDHVHALLWFPETLQLSQFMSKWKELTSKTLKTILSDRFPNYWSQIDSSEPIWQPRYYGSIGTPRPARWVWPEGTATTNAAPGQSSGAPSTAWRQ